MAANIGQRVRWIAALGMLQCLWCITRPSVARGGGYRQGNRSSEQRDTLMKRWERRNNACINYCVTRSSEDPESLYSSIYTCTHRMFRNTDDSSMSHDRTSENRQERPWHNRTKEHMRGWRQKGVEKVFYVLVSSRIFHMYRHRRAAHSAVESRFRRVLRLLLQWGRHLCARGEGKEPGQHLSDDGASISSSPLFFTNLITVSLITISRAISDM